MRVTKQDPNSTCLDKYKQKEWVGRVHFPGNKHFLQCDLRILSRLFF